MSAFTKEFSRVSGMIGLAVVMSLGATDAFAQRGHHDRHDVRPGHGYNDRYRGHDRFDRYDNRRDHFNRHYTPPRPYPYYRPAPTVCVPVETYNYRRHRYEWINVCAPRTYR